VDSGGEDIGIGPSLPTIEKVSSVLRIYNKDTGNLECIDFSIRKWLKT
jgi:hypothetical protein